MPLHKDPSERTDVIIVGVELRGGPDQRRTCPTIGITRCPFPSHVPPVFVEVHLAVVGPALRVPGPQRREVTTNRRGHTGQEDHCALAGGVTVPGLDPPAGVVVAAAALRGVL